MTRCNQRPSSELEALDLSLPKVEEERIERPLNERVPPYGLGRGKVLLTPPSDDEDTPNPSTSDETPSYGLGRGKGPIIPPQETTDGEEEEDSGRWDSDWDTSEEEYWEEYGKKLPPLPEKEDLPTIPRPINYVARKRPALPPLPAMEAEERDTHKRANRERYHLAAYELQDDMWNEEKRFDAAYVRKVNEIWGISDHPMSDEIPETETHPWSDPKNTEEPLNKTL